MQELERLGLGIGPCTPSNEQADAFAVLDGCAKLELSAEAASDASTYGCGLYHFIDLGGQPRTYLASLAKLGLPPL